MISVGDWLVVGESDGGGGESRSWTADFGRKVLLPTL